MSDWIDFYDFKHSVIYVNARHRDVHYRTIAQDIRAYVPSPTAHVLDYGCGEATSAELVAAACGQLVLAEAAPNVRASLTMHYAADPKITVISAEQAAALPKASFDLIVMHSVAQYLSDTELERLLAMFRTLLKPGPLHPRRYRAAAPRRTVSSVCPAALRHGQRVFLGRDIRPDADLRLRLSAPAQDDRAFALH